MRKSSHFNDRIKNLSDLALDGSSEGKTLLFSHIADLFLQNHPMKSSQQDQMFCDILNELISDVDLAVRREVSDTVCGMKSPPAQLIRLLSQDLDEVSAPILQNCPIDDSDLLDLVRYGTEDHRRNISKRFGLSSLVRHELAKYAKDDQKTTEPLIDAAKISLNELTDNAHKKNIEIDEKTTEEILHLIREQKLSDPAGLENDIVKSARKLSKTFDQSENLEISPEPYEKPSSEVQAQLKKILHETPSVSQPEIIHEPSGQVDVIPPRKETATDISTKPTVLEDIIPIKREKNKQQDKILNPFAKKILKTMPTDDQGISIFAKVRAKFSRDRDIINESKSVSVEKDDLSIPDFLKDLNEFEKNKHKVNIKDEIVQIPAVESPEKINAEDNTVKFETKLLKEKEKKSPSKNNLKPTAVPSPTPHYADDSAVSHKISNFHTNASQQDSDGEHSSKKEPENDKVTLIALSKAIHEIAEQMKRLDDGVLHHVQDDTLSTIHEDISHQENAITEALEKIKSMTPPKEIVETVKNIETTEPSLEIDDDFGEIEELHVPNILGTNLTEELTTDLPVAENQNDNNSYKDYAESMADWFWETDRLGNLQFLSDESFSAFAHPVHDLIGENLINLCDLPYIESDTIDQRLSFELLFERRLSFREVLFNIKSIKGGYSQWLLSAIALFDIPTGRFTGFRGSAKAYIEDNIDKLPIEENNKPQDILQEQPAMPEIFEEQHFEEQQSAETIKKSSENQTRSIESSNMDAPSTIEETIIEGINAPEMPSEEMNFSHKEELIPINEPNEESQETVVADLLQNLSHELRTPLNAIIGFSEMIEMEVWGPANDQYHTQIQHILLAARGLKESIDNVLDSAKLDAGLMDNSPKDFSLKSIIEHSLSSILPFADQLNVVTSEKAVDFDITLHRDQNIIELCLIKIFNRALSDASKGEKLGITVRMDSKGNTIISTPLLGKPVKSDQKNTIFQKIAYPSEENVSEENKQNHEKIITPGFGLSVARDLANLIGAELRIETKGEFISHFLLVLKADDVIIS